MRLETAQPALEIRNNTRLPALSMKYVDGNMLTSKMMAKRMEMYCEGRKVTEEANMVWAYAIMDWTPVNARNRTRKTMNTKAFMLDLPIIIRIVIL